MRSIVDILNEMDFRKKLQSIEIENLSIDFIRTCYWRKLGQVRMNPIIKLVDILAKNKDNSINFTYEFEFPWRQSRFMLTHEESPFDDFPILYMDYKLCDDIEDSDIFRDNSMYYSFGSGMACRANRVNSNIDVLKLAYALASGNHDHFNIKDKYVFDARDDIKSFDYFANNEIIIVSKALEGSHVMNYEIEVKDDYIDEDEKEIVEYARKFMEEREERKAQYTKKEVSV